MPRTRPSESDHQAPFGLFKSCHDCYIGRLRAAPVLPVFAPVDAGWSSPVARQAHNLKVIGSNPIPATKKTRWISHLGRSGGFFHDPAPGTIASVPARGGVA